jgi:uncharacterized membrane protein
MNTNLTTALLIAASSMAVSQASAQVSATFEFIFDPINGDTAYSANDMSPDGRWVVGTMDLDGDFFPDAGYRWDRVNDVFTIIESTGTGSGTGTVNSISDDGSVVLGNIPEGETSHTAGIWTDEDGWVSIGALPNAGTCPGRSSSYEISGDGTIAVGLSWDGCSGRGFKWTQATGMQELEVLGSGGNRASVMSADGSVIAGFARATVGRTPAVWDGNTLAGMLVDPSGEFEGEITGISDDGSVLLGTGYVGGLDFLFDAIRIDNGVISTVGEGSVIGGWYGRAQDIADNGTVVGFDTLPGSARRAWIQPFGEGPCLELVAWLNSLGANVPAGTNLDVIQAISSDGRTMVGLSAFGTPAWVITLDFGCPADLTGDGELNFFDVSEFLAAFAAGDLAADFDANGEFNFFDVSAFLSAFSAGCP